MINQNINQSNYYNYINPKPNFDLKIGDSCFHGNDVHFGICLGSKNTIFADLISKRYLSGNGRL